MNHTMEMTRALQVQLARRQTDLPDRVTRALQLELARRQIDLPDLGDVSHAFCASYHSPLYYPHIALET